jgi:hypothetical protein
MYPMLSTGSPSVQKMILTDNGVLQYNETDAPDIEIEINFGHVHEFKRAVHEKMCALREQVTQEQGGDSAIKNIQPVLTLEGVPLDKAFQPAIDAQTQLSEKQKRYQQQVREGFAQKLTDTKAEVGQSLRATAGQILGGVPKAEKLSANAKPAEESIQEKLKKQLKKPWVILAGIALGFFVLGYLIWLFNPKAPFAES